MLELKLNLKKQHRQFKLGMITNLMRQKHQT